MDNFFNSSTDGFRETINTDDTPKIDPEDPFENFTEYKDYNSDYREIVPQIDIPGCVIPFEPSRREKQRIRYFFNIVGIGILLHLIVSEGLYVMLRRTIQYLIMLSDGVNPAEATPQYMAGLNNFFNESSIHIGTAMIVISLCNILVFLLGSLVSKTKPESYFRTKNFTVTAAVSYCIISFFLRYIGGLAGVVFELVSHDTDLSAATDMMGYQQPKTIIIFVLYACIIAPVTEELMFRGFVLKNLSRVSQRFGIIMSGILFGLAHGNMLQFLFASVLGIFLAHIDIKHNSIWPSIIVHSFSNTFSVAITYSGALNNMFTTAIIGLFMLMLGIAGLVLFIIFFRKNRLPYSMPHQKLRNSTAVSSVFFVAAIVVYVIIIILTTFPSVMESIRSVFS